MSKPFQFTSRPPLLFGKNAESIGENGVLWALTACNPCTGSLLDITIKITRLPSATYTFTGGKCFVRLESQNRSNFDLLFRIRVKKWGQNFSEIPYFHASY